MAEWANIPGYEAYYKVSSEGQVLSIRWKRVMSPSTSSRGYKRVVLHAPGVKPKTIGVHILVMWAFVGPTPAGMVVCHNNGDPSDNRLSNLRYDTSSSNMYDKERHGTNHNRNRTHCPRGHLLEQPNLQKAKLKLGCRSCRACHQARSDIHNGVKGSLQELSDLRYAKLVAAGH